MTTRGDKGVSKRDENKGENKYVVITGAGGGMGAETAKLLNENGFFVFALDKKQPALGALPQQNSLFIQTDVTNEQSVAEAFEKIARTTKKLYAVIHFAGVYALDSFLEMSAEKFEKVFKINLFGAFLINKAAAPFLKAESENDCVSGGKRESDFTKKSGYKPVNGTFGKSKGGKIIITTSELAPLKPLPFTGLYAVTKSALDKYAYSLKMEAQLLGISVSVIRAGAVKTDMLGVSTTALDEFCNNTKNYKYNAARFKHIVDSVEAKSVLPKKIAQKTLKILSAKRAKFAYSVNRNPLLRLLSLMPERFQFWVIKKILK